MEEELLLSYLRFLKSNERDESVRNEKILEAVNGYYLSLDLKKDR